MKKLGFIYFVLFFLLSCKMHPEPFKVEKITYYNYSNHPIKKIVLDIISEKLVVLDRVEISKTILPQDSLVFTYNLENSQTTQISRQIATHVYFGEQPYDFNEIITPFENSLTGRFDIRSIYEQKVYISDSTLLYCLIEPKNKACDLSRLK